MKILEKLQIIKTLSGLSQTELANELNVSFPTLNSWINGKSEPRAKKVAMINSLFQKYSGLKSEVPDSFRAKKEIINVKANKHKNLVDYVKSRTDLYNQLVLSFTYNTNSIEGSTLTENETAGIIFEGITIKNKDLVEHLEAKNHQAAFDFLFEHVSSSERIDENFILRLHEILMNGIKSDAGIYRKHGVRIVGSNVPTTNHLKVPERMKEFVGKINAKTKDIVAHVALIHSIFEQIHPFSDGNGRVGRLIMAAMLLEKNLAPAVIKKQKKLFYYKCLRKSQLENEHTMLEEFVADAVLEGFLILES